MTGRARSTVGRVLGGVGTRIVGVVRGRGGAVPVSRGRLLAATPDAAKGTRSSVRIDRLLEIVGGSRYLEIGVQGGLTLEAVHAATVVGVDPAPTFRLDVLPTQVRFHRLPSDDWFAGPGRDARFDVVLVDGLHEYRQVWRDLWNALDRVGPRGAVVLDDVVPCDEIAAMLTLEEAQAAGGAGVDPWPGHWMGDVHRCVAALDAHAADLVDWRTVVDEGLFHQTIVWWRGDDRRRPAVDEAALEAAGRGTFHELFGAGVPAHFRLTSDHAAERDLSAAVTSRAIEA